MRCFLRSPRLMLQVNSSVNSNTEEIIQSVFCLEDLILYLQSGVVYSSRTNYLKATQTQKVVDKEISHISPINSNYAVLLSMNGAVRVFSNYTGYTQDIFKLDLRENKKEETDPIHDILICACPEVCLLCIANLDVLYIMEIDLGHEDGKLCPDVDDKVEEIPKLISTTKLVMELDADIESGCIWGNKNVQFIVYRSGTSIFMYELKRDDRNSSKGVVAVESAAEYRTNHSTFISAVSSGAVGIGVTGDIQGCLIIWKLSNTVVEEENNSGSIECRKMHPWINDNDSFSMEITCINIVSEKFSLALIVSDTDGNIRFLDIDENLNLLTIRFMISGGTFGMCHPTHIKYNTDATEHRLRVSSRVVGNSIDFILDDQIKTCFNTTNSIVYDEGHRNFILSACAVTELGVLFLATSVGVINMYDFRRGTLITSIPDGDIGDICKLTSFCSSIISKKCKFYLGTHSGYCREYWVCFNSHTSFVRSKASNDADIFALISKDEEEINKKWIQEGHQHIPDEVDAVYKTFDKWNMSEDAGCLQRPGVTIKLIYSRKYTNLPVTDIIYSSLGLHAVICYARQKLIVYNSELNKPISQIEMHGSVLNISALGEILSVNQEKDRNYTSSDKLIVVLLGLHVIKVLDVLKKEYIFMLDSFPPNAGLVSCRLWRTVSGKIEGLYCSVDFTLSSIHFSEGEGVQSQTIIDSHSFLRGINLYDFVSGKMHIYQDQGFTLLLTWNFRSLSYTLLKTNVDNVVDNSVNETQTTPVTLIFSVDDIRCRVVESFALNIPSRSDRVSRIVCVLSDGNVYYIGR